MRKLTFTLLLTVCTFLTYAQFPVFVENFDFPPGCMTTSGTGPTWSINTRIQTSVPNSDTSYIDVNSNSYLESDGNVCPISTFGNTFVTLSFKHICKVDFFDSGTIEVSTDGGNTWVKLVDNNGPTDNCIYLGTSNFSTQNSKFQEASYTTWQPGQPTVPDNSWWKTELFDISQIAGNQADVRIRFRLWDENGNGNAPGRTGWAIDDIEVIAAPCELNAPNLTGLPPVYGGTIYNLGPFDVNISATDASGIQSATLTYSINGIVQGSIPMTNTVDSTYNCQIPAALAGDTICYQIQVTDNAQGCFNTSWFPSDTSEVCFIVENGITFPFCDFFDIPNNLWSTTVTGAQTSIWELGTPAFGQTSGAFSAPNAWDINLTTQYTSNADASLISPVLSFPPVAVGAVLSFKHNFSAENGWDGHVLQYTFDDITTVPNPTWQVLGSQNCAGCVNWYNDAQLNSSTLPAWTNTSTNPVFTGQSAGGWIESSIELDATFNNQPIVYFRFRFTSDGIIETDGVSIDNFCIALPQPEDVGVNAVLSPGFNAPAGSNVDVTVQIKNFGINPQSIFDVTYSDGVNPPVTEAYTGATLNAGQTAQFTFSTLYTVMTGNNNICAWTELPNDGNNFNDTSCTSSLGIPINSLTFCDDFESGNLGWQDSTSNANTNWQLGTPAFNATSGAFSGTNAWDINLNSAYTTNTRAYLKSPFYDLSTAVNPILKFMRNQNSAGVDGLVIQYALNGSATWQTLGTVNDPDGFNWYNNGAIVNNTPGFAGNTNGWVESRYFLQTVAAGSSLIQFRLVFNTAFNGLPNDGISIDDWCLVQPGPDDVGVVSIVEPLDALPEGSTSDVIVVIRNFGSQPQSNIPVEFTVNAVVSGSAIFAGPLPPNGTATVNLGTFTVPSCQYDFCAYTQLPGDSDNSNDTTCVDRIGIPVITVDYLNPYIENFDGANNCWYTGILGTGSPTSRWELGGPSFGATNSPYSVPNSWDVNLLSAYTASANCYLASPIFDIQGVDPEMAFFLNYNTELNFDGTRLEFSINGGPWVLMGGFGPTFSLPCWYNWYNIANINSSNQPAWAGNSAGWKPTEANCLSGFNNAQVQFRYVFSSDPSVNIDGVSLDDFSLTVPVPLSAAPLNIQTNTINNTFVFPGQAIDFTTDLYNRGTTPLDTLIATLYIDNNPVEIDTVAFAPQLLRDNFVNHVWDTQWIASPGVHDICVVTSQPNFMADLNTADDTTCIQISVFDSVTVSSGNPYCTDFESGPTWVSVNALTYIDGPANTFELGTPSLTIINGANSGVNAWMTDLNAFYINSDSSGLFTPVFAIDNANCYRLSFSHIFDTEKNFDGGTVEFSIDNAQTWTQLGWASSSPDWFNTNFITGLGGSPGNGGWSGTQSSWSQVFRDVNFNGTSATNVIFRFRFQSDPSGSNFEGWAIDDFCFEEIASPCFVGLENPAATGLALGQNVPNPYNGLTTIKYTLPEAGAVKISISDVLGQEIAVPVNGNQIAGTHNFDFDSGSIAAGIYYYTLDFNGERISRKMIIE